MAGAREIKIDVIQAPYRPTCISLLWDSDIARKWADSDIFVSARYTLGPSGHRPIIS